MSLMLRKTLPEPIKQTLRHGLDVIGRLATIIFATNRWMANVYYFFFSRDFDREHLAVLKGRVAYYHALHAIAESSPLAAAECASAGEGADHAASARRVRRGLHP